MQGVKYGDSRDENMEDVSPETRPSPTYNTCYSDIDHRTLAQHVFPAAF